jgi:hypothetical protein
MLSVHVESPNTIDQYRQFYLQEEPILCEKIKSVATAIANDYIRDLKGNVNLGLFEDAIRSSLEEDFFTMSLFGFFLSEKSSDIQWKSVMEASWNPPKPPPTEE